MSQSTGSLTVGDVIVGFNALDQVTQVTIRGQSVEDLVGPLLDQINISANFKYPHKNRVNLPQELKGLLESVLNVSSQIRKGGRHCLAADLDTRFFQLLTSFPNRFMVNCQYSLACSYWLEILSCVRDWESTNNAKVHKGHPYFFLAFAYLLSGDLDAGFVYAYNAIEDDKALGKHCPQLHYPEEAPIYLTVLMVDDKRNAMYDLVKELRNELDKYLGSYRTVFGRQFSISDFDAKFLRSLAPDLENLRYLFVFCFWSFVELTRKTEAQILHNDFSKLRNLNLIFNLCLLIDKLLEANPKIGKDKMSANVLEVCNNQKWLSGKDIQQLETVHQIDISGGDPDKVLKVLLPMSLRIGSKSIPREAIHYLIAWNLRNYSGHKIKQQQSLVEKFDDILRILMNCIILSIDLF